MRFKNTKTLRQALYLECVEAALWHPTPVLSYRSLPGRGRV